MYVYERASGLSAVGLADGSSLKEDLRKHIANRGVKDPAARLDAERRQLQRTLVIIAENHSATTRSADLARRLLDTEAYRFIASEAFANAGSFRLEIRDFLRGTRTSLSPNICSYSKLLEDLRKHPRLMLFAGSRASDNRDARLTQHFLDEIADRKLPRTAPGIFVCGINHAARRAADSPNTMRQRLEGVGVRVLGVRLMTDDFDRQLCREKGRLLRTDAVWPLGAPQTDANAINLLDFVTGAAEYTVVPTAGSPFARVTDDRRGDDAASIVSIADRYEFVVLAKKMAEPCREDVCASVLTRKPASP